MSESITAWRVRWEDEAFVYSTEWSTEYDLVHGLMDEKYTDMPGADVRFERLTIDLSTPDPEYEVEDLTNQFPQWADLDADGVTCSVVDCENDAVVKRDRKLYCRPCADYEFDDMPWQATADPDEQGLSEKNHFDMEEPWERLKESFCSPKGL